jgi:hypothetical protein
VAKQAYKTERGKKYVGAKESTIWRAVGIIHQDVEKPGKSRGKKRKVSKQQIQSDQGVTERQKKISKHT